MSCGDHVEQFTFLLFLKTADKQSKPPFNKPSPIPKWIRSQHGIPLAAALGSHCFETHWRAKPPARGTRARRRLITSEEILLGVGLTRAYSDWLSNQPPRHWLQVHNLHFIEEPIRRLPEASVAPLA